MEENYPVPNIATDAVEIAFAAISGLIAHKPKIYRELLPLEALLRKAMLHHNQPNASGDARQMFYDEVARLACDTDLQWHCTFNRELFVAFQKYACSGNKMAKHILKQYEIACQANPKLKNADLLSMVD